ncbi:MAG: oligosaccharide flippase family protein [Candidatus Gracilibacteria bacterium]|nr:oligosaccharide flippase family protein [Candidatus Gracilibacteria bacterium]
MIENHSTLSEKFIKKGFWLYLFSFIIAPIGYIIKILITGEISIEEVGLLYGIISLITLLSSFNDFGMTESLNYFLPKYIEKKDYSKVKTIIAYAFITQVITGIIISLFLIFGADFLAENYFKSEQASSILKIFALYFLGINIFQVFNNFFMVVQNTFYNRITEFLRMLFILFSIYILIYMDLGNVINFSYAWMSGLYFGIIFVIYFFYTKYYKNYLSGIKYSFSRKLFKKVFNYAIIVFIAAQAATILSQMDMQMIIYFLGNKSAGYYTAYLSIITIPFMIIGPIFGLLFPVFSQLHAQKDYKKIALVKQVIQKNFIAIALAFNILFFVFAETIAYILFGGDYIKSGIILQYSILFLTFNFLLQINFNILAGIGKVKERLKIILIALLFNFILNIILINGLEIINFEGIGVEGAALATGFGWLLIWILSEIKLGKKYFSHFDYSFFTKNIIFLGLLGLFSYCLINPLFNDLSRIKSFGLLFIIGTTWFILFFIINRNDFKSFIGEIKKIKKGK